MLNHLITGQGAEHATYDFDDDDYEVQGGLQKRKDKQKRGYEPVESVNEYDLGLTYKKGKTVKVKHKKSGKELVIVDKPNVRKEYEKIGFYAESANEGQTQSIGGEELMKYLMKRFKMSKSKAIATMKKHKMEK